MFLIKKLCQIYELWGKPRNFREVMCRDTIWIPVTYWKSVTGFGSLPRVNYHISLREIIRVYSQIPTHEWIKVKRKIDTPRYLALLDTKCFKNSKTERNNKPNKPLLHTTKALSL